jgi:hypothetical protein
LLLDTNGWTVVQNVQENQSLSYVDASLTYIDADTLKTRQEMFVSPSLSFLQKFDELLMYF